jgi:hypothetical protein
MGSFIHQDRIAEKLEIARTMGFVTDYSVAPMGPSRRPEAGVRVWRSANASDEAVKDYLACVLQGLVRGDHIVIIPPFVVSQPIADVPTEEPVDATLVTAVPVAA